MSATKKNPILAYHFVGDKLRDGQPIPANKVWLEHKGPIRLRNYGLHASRHPQDALEYAPGPTLCLVQMAGECLEEIDKLVATRRRILKRFDATELLREYTRWCALQVIELWDAPEIVRRYLLTGAESLRYAAGSAAEYAAWSAARSAAGSAASSAARSAAWSAAGSAAWSAAGYAAVYAARSTAWSAAKYAQREHFKKLVDTAFSNIK
jgi:hypothetical protein